MTPDYNFGTTICIHAVYTLLPFYPETLLKFKTYHYIQEDYITVITYALHIIREYITAM
jgi:hypothetical protein